MGRSMEDADCERTQTAFRRHDLVDPVTLMPELGTMDPARNRSCAQSNLPNIEIHGQPIDRYEVKDATGREVEHGKKLPNGNWVIEHADAKGTFHRVTGIHIKQVFMNENGNISRLDDKNIDHEIDIKTNERFRWDGNKLLAQWSGDGKQRIEYGPAGRPAPGGESPLAPGRHGGPMPEAIRPPVTIRPPEASRPPEGTLPRVTIRPPEPVPPQETGHVTEPVRPPQPVPPESTRPPRPIDGKPIEPPRPERASEATLQPNLEITNNPVENGRRLFERLRSIKGGETLVLPAGNYQLPNRILQLNGTDGHPIRIIGSGIGKTVLTGGGDNSVLHFNHSSNFSIENLSIESHNSLHDLRIQNSSNVRISGNFFGPTQWRSDDDNSSVQFGGACRNVEVVHNRIEAKGGPEGTKTHCVYFGQGESGRASEHVRVADNYLHYSGGECGAMVQFNSNGMGTHHDVLVEDNVFRSGARSSGRDYGGGGIALAGIDSVTIRKNDMRIARGAFIEVWGGGVSNGIVEENKFELTGVPRSRNEFVISGAVRNVSMRANDPPVYNGVLRAHASRR